jgi:nucleotidyltransferase substrate binding protein (TIGR01987 family)
MSWKTLKRVLDAEGVSTTTPRFVFKEAFSFGLIENEKIWLEMIECRNHSSHVYDEAEMKLIEHRFLDFLLTFQKLQENLQTRQEQ